MAKLATFFCSNPREPHLIRQNSQGKWVHVERWRLCTKQWGFTKWS